ncbi:hypothetical protein L210DRAFT_3548209 [Boletus edulis BED1]|uniref:Uncharacterized protein n=1 Tax=Boletus edulis BED1 TaxID=1328754 RepID=A0AAD4BQA0_BOLED|nr:hypothetical protein L210DRAFT_3548209 [Boletus edulis BED1]
MFARLASVFIALVVVAGVVVADCPVGQKSYCCGSVTPNGVLGYNCPPFDPASGYSCSGQKRCCVYQDTNGFGYGCSDA